MTRCQFSNSVYSEYREGRKIIFLANTVPLVNQQAEYFRSCLTNTFLNDDSQHVECLTGDRNIDVWKNDKWNEVLQKFEVSQAAWGVERRE